MVDKIKDQQIELRKNTPKSHKESQKTEMINNPKKNNSAKNKPYASNYSIEDQKKEIQKQREKENQRREKKASLRDN